MPRRYCGCLIILVLLRGAGGDVGTVVVDGVEVGADVVVRVRSGDVLLGVKRVRMVFHLVGGVSWKRDVPLGQERRTSCGIVLRSEYQILCL